MVLNRIFFIFCIFITNISNAQIITTFAGGGTGGDGGPATAADVYSPVGGVFDKYGNYYFVSSGGNTVRKINTSGIIYTIAGTGATGATGDGGPATAASLFGPQSVCLDSLDNIYIADAGNAKIRKIDATTGIITTIVGNGMEGYDGDNGPATTAKLYDPQDICFDKAGNLYIADAENHRIRKVNPAGTITTFAGSGTWGGGGDGGQATNADLKFPSGLAFDQTGNLYFSDWIDHHVRMIRPSGIITRIAGNSGYTFSTDHIPATTAGINPARIGMNKYGDLFIADDYNNRVFRVDQHGILHVVTGNGLTSISGEGIPATASTMYFPSGISFDSCGNVYIPEINYARIRKITYPNCGYLSIASLDFSEAGVKCYPNPVIGELVITSTDKIKNITISNLLGQVVFRQSYNEEEIVRMNTSDFASGLYFVKVACPDASGGWVYVERIVKD